MQHATSRQLFAYWDRLRGAARAPRQSDIEPGAIRSILSETFLLEVADDGRYVIRLAGTRVCGLYCRELRGGDFLDLWSGDDRRAVAHAAIGAVKENTGAVVTTEATTLRERHVGCEVILLPLRQDREARVRIIGSFAAFEQPYWLGNEPIAAQSVASLRMVRPSDALPTTLPSPALPVAAVAVVAAVTAARGRRRGHLVVMDGGKR